ncbi:MAG: DUF5110 domain-containing protein, partial [Ktedonobacterales bacterium]
DWHTGRCFAGPLRAHVDAPLDTLPLFAREGAIVPLGPTVQYSGERPDGPLTLACYLGDEDGASAVGELYEDDGATLAYEQGAWRRTRFTAATRSGGGGGTITLSADSLEGAYDAAPPEWLVELHLPHVAGAERPAPSSSIRLNGSPLDPAGCERIPRRYETLLRIPLGRVNLPFTLAVTLG